MNILDPSSLENTEVLFQSDLERLIMESMNSPPSANSACQDRDFASSSIFSQPTSEIEEFANGISSEDLLFQDLSSQPFQASDLILEELSSSDSFSNFFGQSTPCSLSAKQAPEITPLSPKSLNSIASSPRVARDIGVSANRNAFSSPFYNGGFCSPRPTVGTVSFSIKAGRIVSPKRTPTQSEEEGGIFRTPSSKRRLDFCSMGSSEEGRSSRPRLPPSRLVVGAYEEGLLQAQKENIPPHVQAGSLRSNLTHTLDVNPIPVDTFRADMQSIFSSTSSLKTQSVTTPTGISLELTTGKSCSLLESPIIKDNLSPIPPSQTELLPPDKKEKEEELIDPDYCQFVLGCLGESNLKPEEEDPEDEVFEPSSETELPPRRSGYRIREEELNDLIDDCRQIIDDEDTQRAFRRLQPKTLRVDAVKEAPLDRLARLVDVHVQLLEQEFILSLTAGTVDSVSIAKAAYCMLSELRAMGEAALAQLGRSLVIAPGGRWCACHRKGNCKCPQAHEGEENNSSHTGRLSLFSAPGLERLALLRPAIDRMGLMDQEFKPVCSIPRDLPHAMQTFFVIMGPIASDKWKPIPFKPDLTERTKFYDSEDRLLLRGLCKYGTSNWSQIHSQFIPSKLPKQISHRYKNLISRMSPPNPIKDFYFRQYLPLSGDERRLLHEVEMAILGLGRGASWAKFWTDL